VSPYRAIFIAFSNTSLAEREFSTLMSTRIGRSHRTRPGPIGLAAGAEFAFSTSFGMDRFGCVSIECPKTKQLP
jgi:hypothetical protein